MADWKQLSQSHELCLADFPFASGERLSLKLHCSTLGKLNEARGNTVLLLHGTSDSSLQFLKPDTADFLFGQGQPLDRGEYFIIMPDAIGHRGSSKPSDGLWTKFPKYSYTDMVVAQYAVVRELFALEHLRLVLGTSMGGMQTWMWGIAYPEMMDALVAIACLPEKLSGQNLLFRRLILPMIQSDPSYAGGESAPTSHGMGLAWNLFELMAASQAKLAEQFEEAEAADRNIRKIVQETESSQHAVDVIWEFEASRDYDPNGEIDKIKASLLTVNFADDDVNSSGLENLDRDIKRVPRGRAVAVDAGAVGNGHQTLAKAEVLQEYVREVLAQR